MNHRLLRFPGGWEWHMITRQGEDDDWLSLKKAYPACAEWIDTITEDATGRIHTGTRSVEHGFEPLIYGGLELQMSEAGSDIQHFHFWLSGSQLFTVAADLRILIRLQQAPWQDKLQQAASAADGFVMMAASFYDPLDDCLHAMEKQLVGIRNTLSGETSGTRTTSSVKLLAARSELVRLKRLYTVQHALETVLKGAPASEVPHLTLRRERTGLLFSQLQEELEFLCLFEERHAAMRSRSVIRTGMMFMMLLTPPLFVSLAWYLLSLQVTWANELPVLTAFASVMLLLIIFIYTTLRGKENNPDKKSVPPGRLGRSQRRKRPPVA